MNDYVIAEEFELPSQGKVYSKVVNPNVKLRSMTTQEEMKRLSHSDSPYKMLSEIIDDCLVEKPGISVYDMNLGDYQFLLYKLRTVTYGPKYNIISICPYCSTSNKQTVNLDDLNISKYSEDYENHLNIKLPVTGKNIKIKMQTPRMFDEINKKVKNLQKSSPNIKSDTAFLFNLEALIEKVDDEIYNPAKLEAFVRSLPMMDVNFILKHAEKLNQIGIDSTIETECCNCHRIFKQTLPITGEFFGPGID